MHETKKKLLEAGLTMLLERGYNDLGVQLLLQQTETPKGSFYHHFSSKEDFALQVIDLYMTQVHAGLEACLTDDAVPPLRRVRNFFEATRDKYGEDGYLGCMIGGLGQELSGVSPVFQKKIEDCFSIISGQIARCFGIAKDRGDLGSDTDPDHLASLLVNCWEGAALRCRLRRSPAPLNELLDFYFATALASPKG